MNYNIIEKNTGIVGNGQDIIYADGKYFLVSSSPAKVCYSENLENWTEIELNSNYLQPTSIIYGNGTFIISGLSGLGTDNTYIYRSTDGINWELKQLSTGRSYSQSINAAKFCNNNFILMAGYYYYNTNTGERTRSITQIFMSKNGIDWTMYEYTYWGSKVVTPSDITYHNNLYVRVGYAGTIFTSTNLENWTEQSSGTEDRFVSVSYGKGQYIAVGDNGMIMTSSDGINWIKQDSGSNSLLTSSHYSNGMYIVCGYNGTILQSINGISWINVTINPSGLMQGLCVNGNRFVINATYYSNTHTIPIFYFDVTRDLSEETEDSSLFFFNKDLELLGVVDYFISLRWQRKYFEAGEFEIVLPVTDYIMKLIDTDVLIMRNNYTEAGIVETIEFNDDGENEEVTISGRFLSSILERRIVKSKINFSGNTIEGMNTIVNAMTPLTTQWETEAVTMSSPAIDFQCTYKNVYEYLCKLSEYSNIGFRVVPNVDAKVYMFEVWQGLDRTASQTENTQYSFSDDNFNIEQGSLTISSKSKVGYVLVGGAGEATDRVLVEVNSGLTGFDLYEVFSDQKSSSSDDLSDSEYKAQLQSVGEAKLCDGTFQFEVTATSQQDYKNKWDLGDVVNIKKEKWGIYTTYRIIEVEEVIEDGKKTVYPTFGSPLATAWKDE